MALQPFVNRRYTILFSRVPQLTYISGELVIGSTGAVASIKGSNLYAITRLTTGIYQVQLNANHKILLSAQFLLLSPAPGSTVNAGSFVTNTLYQITTVGNTNWTAIGLAAGLTAAVGMSFMATGPGSGTGVATAITNTGIDHVEVAQNPQVMSQVSPPGAIFNIQTLLNTTLTNPVVGSRIRMGLMVSGSSLGSIEE